MCYFGWKRLLLFRLSTTIKAITFSWYWNVYQTLHTGNYAYFKHGNIVNLLYQRLDKKSPMFYSGLFYSLALFYSGFQVKSIQMNQKKLNETFIMIFLLL